MSEVELSEGQRFRPDLIYCIFIFICFLSKFLKGGEDLYLPTCPHALGRITWKSDLLLGHSRDKKNLPQRSYQVLYYFSGKESFFVGKESLC